jgi:hypothetical protein
MEKNNKKTKRIKIFSSFCSSENCKESFERVNNAKSFCFYGEDKEFYITNNDDYTHAIILNVSMPELKIPKENVLGLAFEPIYFLGLTEEFILYAKKHIGKYFIGDKMDLPDPFIEHFGYMWFSRPPKEITYKDKIMSIILSDKKFAPGHIYRHILVQTIIQNNLPIDIYGNGSIEYEHERVKGLFNDEEPYKDYMYTICIENFICNHYFSEKVINPLMYNCVPIYSGCRNIEKYVENVIILTDNNNLNDDMKIIINILNNPISYHKRTYTERNLESINLIRNLHKLF